MKLKLQILSTNLFCFQDTFETELPKAVIQNQEANAKPNIDIGSPPHEMLQARGVERSNSQQQISIQFFEKRNSYWLQKSKTDVKDTQNNSCTKLLAIRMKMKGNGRGVDEIGLKK